MIIDRYDPVNLFELVPQLQVELDPELAALDKLLDDDGLFQQVKADLLRAVVVALNGRQRTLQQLQSGRFARILLWRGDGEVFVTVRKE